MALPVNVPNEFANAVATIQLSQLDVNFNTLSNAINGIANGVETLANVQISGGNISNVSLSNVTVSGETLDNVTLSNVTIVSGNATVTDVVCTTANVTTGNIATVNATTVNTTDLDLTNIEVTNIKAKDGTSAMSIADSTGKVSVTSEFAVDNLNFSLNTISSTDTNGDIFLTPDGSGEVNISKVDIDAGAIDGTAIGANSASTGKFTSVTDTGLTATRVTYATTGGELTDSASLTFDGTTLTAGGFTTSGTAALTTVNATTVDTTNIEVTNLKAKDGTSAGSIADSTGVVTLASSVLTTTDINGGSIDGVTLGTNSAVTEAQIDNINIDGNAITSTNTDGNIALTPDGTGEVDISKVDIASGEIDGVTLGTNSPVTEAQIDNINIDGNTISSTDTDGNLVLTPNGAGDLVLDGLNWPQADGTLNQALTTNGSGQLAWSTVAGSPGGSDTQIQYNNAGSFGGASGLTTDGSNLTIGAQGDLRLADSDSSNYIALQAPATVASDVTLTLPDTAGSSGQVLSTNGSGTLSWVDQSGGGGGGGGTSVTVTQATATASQTTFSVTYTVGQLSVYLNGALLASADYTATNGTSVVLASGAASGDIFTALAYDSATQITQGDTTVEVTDSGTGKVEFTVDNVEVADFTAAAVVFNETGADQDFRVESDTNANMLVVDAGSNKVGIGTNTFNANGGVLQVSNGISFPATQSASTDANTLDDYEEGAWTPTDGSGASLSFTVNYARYTKIGRLVTCNARITYPSTASGSDAQINGLPFTSDSNNHAVSTMSTDQGAYFSLVVTTSTTSLITRNLSLVALTNANLSGKTLIFTVSYIV